MVLHREAAKALASASEGFCSLCNRELSPHDGLACCTCCGTVYAVGDGRLGLSTCARHSHHCEHWDELWEQWRAGRTDQGC